MTRTAPRNLLLLVALLTISLVALQCPMPTCTGCAGDDVIIKQAGVVSYVTAVAVVASAVLPAVESRLAQAAPPVSAAASGLAFRCSRLTI